MHIKITCAEMKGFTVALAATASGKKLSAVIVFKERGGSLENACPAESSYPTQCTSELEPQLDDGRQIPTLTSTRLWEGVSKSLVDC